MSMGGDGAVAITFTGDSRDVERALANMQKQNQRLMDELRKLREESTKNTNDEAKRAQWLAKVKEKSAQLEYQAKLTAVQAEKKIEQERANWLANLKRNSAVLEYQLKGKEIQEARKAAEEQKKIEREKATWLTRLKINSADLERRLNQERLRDIDRILRGTEEQESIVGKLIGSYVTVNTIQGLITSELQDQLRVSKEILGLQNQTAAPQGDFLRNLGVVSAEERKAAVARIGQISKATGVSQSTIYSAGAMALSAAGDLSTYEALNAVEMAARIAPDAPAELSTTAGGLLDLAAVTGTGDARKNAGFMLRIGTQARITSMKDIAENLVPAAKSIMGFGATPEQAAALATTLSTAMKDTTGAQSGTAGIALARQLEEFLPTQDTYTYDARGRRRLDRRGTGLKTLEERIRYMQEHPELLDQFMRQGSWEAKAEVPSRMLLTRGTTEAKLFAERVGGFGGDLGAETDAFLRGMGQEPLQQMADLTRRGTNVSEIMKLEDERRAARAAIFEAVDKYQEARGVPWIDRMSQYGQMQFSDFLYSVSGGRLGASAGRVAQNFVQSDGISGGVSMQAKDTEELRAILEVLKSLDAKATGRPTVINADNHTE